MKQLILYFAGLLLSPASEWRRAWCALVQLKRTRALIDSNLGRAHGWYVEAGGVCVAELHYSRNLEMFWDQYTIIPTASANETGAPLFTNEFWEPRDELVFRNRAFREIAPQAFASATGPDGGMIAMRALYLSPDTKPVTSRETSAT